MSTCPRCGYTRKESDAIIPEAECPKCGIIYSKWKETDMDARANSGDTAQDQAPSKRLPEKKKSIERVVIYAVLIAFLMVAAHQFLMPQVVKYFQPKEGLQKEMTSAPSAPQAVSEPRMDTTVKREEPPQDLSGRSTVEEEKKELSVTEIIRATRQSVVVVKTPSSMGSGFFINSQGHIVTNQHVLSKADSAQIKTAEGQVFRVRKILREDAAGDLVIASTDATPAESKPVRLSSRLPDVGEKIVVIGSPLGLEQTVSDGIVSAVRRNSHAVDLIQITAPVSPGNSGGPLFNMQGDVIGITTFQYRTGQNLNFCIAASRIAALQQGSPLPVSSEAPGPVAVQQTREEVYCYLDSNGKVNFVKWKTGTLITRPDGSLDRQKYAAWALEQLEEHPDNIDPDKIARESLERNREAIFKTVFPHRSISDTNLTQAEKDWVERRYQQHFVEVYNESIKRRNDLIIQYRSMIADFERFSASRQ